MKLKPHHWILLLLFAFTLSLRLYFAFQTPNFSDDNAYFVLRQVEHISENYIPLYNDPLSYGGRQFIFPPFFYYLLAFFDIFLPITIVAKVIPNILASSLVFLSYLIAVELTSDHKVACFTAAISAFIPIFFSYTINSVSVFSLVLPVMAFMIYCLMRVHDDKSFALYFVIGAVVIALSDSSSFILALGLLFYLIMVRVEGMGQSRAELELILFSIFLIAITHILLYRQVLALYGPSFIFQNIPTKVFSNYFSDVPILGAIYLIGSVPFVDGLYVVYKYAFRERSNHLYLLVALVLSVALLLYFKLMPFRIGLMFAGFILVLLFAQSLMIFLAYIKKTKFARFENLSIALTLAIFILSSVVPSLLLASESVRAAQSDGEVSALKWLRDFTSESDVVASMPEEGHLISYIASRQNVMDTNFLMIPNINTRFDDLVSIYTLPVETEAIALLNKYKISYIYLSKKALSSFGISEVPYISDEDCFELVYDDDAKIYKSLCRLQ